MRFIDRSNNNGHDDYKAARVTHLYLKATQGTGFVDSTYHARAEQARQQGVAHVGAYHFAGGGDPVTEANHFLATIGKPGAKALRPCIDVEIAVSAAWVWQFAQRVKAVLGYEPVFYANTSQGSALRNESAAVRSLAWWRAEYGADDGRQYPLAGGSMGCAAHQYTEKATFTGISGYTDASVILDEKAMLVPVVPLKVTVRTGGGASKTFTGNMARTRACARALRLLRHGFNDLTIKANR